MACTLSKTSLDLPCATCTNKQCEERISCRFVDKAIGRGQTFTKHDTYAVDWDFIENTHNPQNAFQRSIPLDGRDVRADLNARFLLNIIEDAVGKILTCREQEVYALTKDGATPIEISKKLQISPERIRVIIKHYRRKLKNFLGTRLELP